MPVDTSRLRSPVLEPVYRYNTTALTLHWLVAALLIVNVVVGLVGVGREDQDVIAVHKSIGLTLFGLILLRVLWRLSHKPPPLPQSYPAYERRAAHGVHWALYAVMLLLPITGYIHDSAWKEAATHPLTLFGLPIPRLGPVETLAPAGREQVHGAFGAAHVYIGFVLYGLFGLHLLGVVKHHVVDHEPELQRMLPGTGRPDPAE